MKKTFIKMLDPYIELHRCPRTGIAWVENGKIGLGHSAHPNIDVSGSIRGMKSLGYWARSAKCVSSHGFIYNIDLCVVDDKYDKIANDHCKCGGNHTIPNHHGAVWVDDQRRRRDAE